MVKLELKLTPFCSVDSFRSGDAVLTPCGLYNNFCCGQDEAARSCCNEGNATLAAQIAGGDLISQGLPASSLSPGSSASSTSGIGPTSTGVPITTGQSSTALKTQRNALIGLTAAFGVLMLLATIWAIFLRRRMRKEQREQLLNERERQRLQQERDALKQEKQRLAYDNQRLTQESHSIEQAIAGLPGPMKRELEAARKNAIVVTTHAVVP